MNDLINSFDWWSVKKNEAYPVFTNASTDDSLPWPNRLDDENFGQVNAFFRWKNTSDTADAIEMSIYLVKPSERDTKFIGPTEAVAAVSLRRLQSLKIDSIAAVRTLGTANGKAQADDAGCVTIPALKITSEPTALIVKRVN